MSYWPLLILLPFVLFLGWMAVDMERELRKLYEMWGTTGFWDVDARFMAATERNKDDIHLLVEQPKLARAPD